jgi:hypothetical protein
LRSLRLPSLFSSHAYFFFRYFGVNSTVLGFSTVDYLMRSVDALFVPVTATAVHLRRVLAGTRRATPGSPASSWAAATEWMIAFALVGISLFAAATDYAAAVGQSRARHFASVLWAQPGVALYSQRSLSMDLPGVTQVRCRDPQAAYRYRYDGLTLVLESGGKYLLLPQEWTPATGAAILISQSDPVRLEFYPPSEPVSSRAAC